MIGSVLIFSLGFEITLCLTTSLKLKESSEIAQIPGKLYLLDKVMVLQVNEAEAKHAPHIGGEVLDVVDSANVVNADLLALRRFEDHNNVELAEELFVFLGENSGVGVDIDHRVECLCTNER